MPKSPILVFAAINRLSHRLFPITGNAGGRVIKQAQYEEKYDAICFRMSMDELRAPLGTRLDQIPSGATIPKATPGKPTLGRDLFMGFSKALSMFHVVDVEFPESERESELVTALEQSRAEAAKWRKECERLTFELSQSPPLPDAGAAALAAIESRAPTVSSDPAVFEDIAKRQRDVCGLYREKTFDDFNSPEFTVHTQEHGKERGFRAIRRVAILAGLPSYDGMKKEQMINALLAHIANANKPQLAGGA